MKEKITRWYNMGLWTERMVKRAAEKGVITQTECEEILSA